MVKLDVTTLRAAHAGVAPRRPPVPKELTQVAAAQAALHPNDKEDLGSVSLTFLEKGSLEKVKQYVADLKDAGNALPVAKNASLYMASFSYHASKAREAWLVEPPKDGKLILQVALTPSWHVSQCSEPTAPKDDAPKEQWDAYDTQWNSYEKSCTDNATKFGLTNKYNVEIHYPDGKIDRHSFAVNGKDPEFSTASPEIEIDLKANKGDITIKGWADGSAGAEGYRSARVTVLHNP